MKKIFAFLFIIAIIFSTAYAEIVPIDAPAGKVFVGPNKVGQAREYSQNPTTGEVLVRCDEQAEGMCVMNHGTRLDINYQPGTGGTNQLYVPVDL